MLANHAAGIAAGSACFGAKARCQRRQAHRQFLLVENGFADEICQRHFGGGNEPEPFAPELVQGIFIKGGQRLSLDRPKLIVFKFRQLPRAEHGVIANHQRRIDFGIAVLVGVEIEHELPDRALQPGQPLLQHDKARSTQCRRRLEIHEAERATDVVMRFRRERVCAGLAEHMALHIAVLVDALGHVVQRQVRNRGKLPGELFVRRLRRQFELWHRGLELGNLRHQRARACVVLRLLGVADFLRRGIAPCLHLLRLEDRRPALLVDRQQRRRQWLQPAPLQAGVEGMGIVADRFDVVHGMQSLSRAG